MRVRGLVICAALLTHVAAAQISLHGAGDITVRLFSTHSVESVLVTPLPCPSCVAAAPDHPLQVRLSKTQGQLLVDAKPRSMLSLSGHLQIKTNAGQTADATGIWQIRAMRDGLHVLVTIPSERYVMAVLSSESAADESLESLKALAVTARSFALTNARRHGVEGLCDSTHCQALRLGPVSALIEAAVRETAGERLWWNGAPVPGYFTQSSGGTTEDAARIWGGAKRPWLVSHADPDCQQQPSQWHAEIAEQQLREALAVEGWKLSAPIEQITVLERDPAGRASKLQIAAHGQRVTVPASALRFAVDRDLGWNRLRSDWYEIHLLPNRIVFDGKGYGHGVGLCQAGAAQMAKQGKDYRSILAFYFPGTGVRVEAGDRGWHRFNGKGWALQSSTAEPALLAAGDAALLDAVSKWPSPKHTPMAVTLYPSTELFRQATGEPGWTLAATRGDRIALQPRALIQRQADLKDLLLHEFLHGMLEQEAGEIAPLWLREGLVEWLAARPNEKPAATNALHPGQIEAALLHASSLAEAQRAHREAGALVETLISRYGLAAVRGWLRDGLPRGIVPGQ